MTGIEAGEPKPPRVACRELILGGQKSGKSRRAEQLAAAWLAQPGARRGVLIATARAGDAQMRERIARHRRERAERLPGLVTVEEPLWLAGALRRESRPDTLVLVDCLTLWLTNWLMPLGSKENRPRVKGTTELFATLSEAIREAAGPVVLVSNEVGSGVTPLGRRARECVDALGWLNQEVARACERVTLMAAGCVLTLKDAPA